MNSTLTRLYWMCALGFAAALHFAPAVSAEPLERTADLGGRARLALLGDVGTVLVGEATGTVLRAADAGEYLAALGCAAVTDDPALQGEAFILGGEALVKSVDAATSYATERREGAFHASFLAGVAAGSTPAAAYSIDAPEGFSVDALYRRLHADHGTLIAVLGTGQFRMLELSAVKKSPAYGEVIIGPKMSEYFHAKQLHRDTSAVFFGLSLRSNAEATPATRRVFYINPDDTLSTGGQTHTHCGLLGEVEEDALPSPDAAVGRITDVAHVLSQSLLTSGELVVYELRED